ncbi:glycosyl transferase [Mycolicibacterium madagascariense]|uniref:Glycosyl transferase n=1 Tax=Mycolicibacterium madagascariense TaxID=212765 RepID=A0A7I7XNZ6_9MYCO|nr:glycosyl transferase [Mycolicibacterium madagascariense]
MWVTQTVEAWEPSTQPLGVEPQPRRPSFFTAERVRLAILLLATAVLYLRNVTVNGMANQYYAAAAQAGSQDWKALLFGAVDVNGFITVDKPPLSLWVMGLSGQVFGFSSASMLVPQALMGVAAVALTYGAVRRISGPWAGLLAGATLAATPVAALLFRFNDPDAAMVLLMTAGAYGTVRALQSGRGRWLAFAGVALGLAFLAKMLEGVMALPVFAAVYLVAAPVRLRVRIGHLAGAAVAFVLSAGWYVVLTMAWPAASRPYLGGSTDDTFMNLVLGYNGMARVVGRGHGAEMRSQGPLRLLSGEFGYEIGWLVPAAVLATVAAVLARGRAPRTDLVRAGALLFGGWFLLVGTVLSVMHGTVHPYYSLSIAPPVAAVVAIGLQQAWSRREDLRWRVVAAAIPLSAGLCGWWLLGGGALSAPWLRWAVLLLAVVSSVAVVWPAAPRRVALAAAVLAALAGPAAYTVATVGVGHEGIGPSVGPSRHAVVEARPSDNPRLDALLEATDTPWSAAIERSTSAAGLELSTGTAVMAIGGFAGTDPVPTLPQFQDYVARHQVTYYLTPKTSAPARGAHADILSWVRTHFRATEVGPVTAYDLLEPLPSPDETP